MPAMYVGNKVARRLADQGCQVAAWNRDASKASALAEAGIDVHQSAQEAISASDVLLLLLSDAAAIQDVLLSSEKPVDLQDKVVLQMGTIGKLHYSISRYCCKVNVVRFMPENSSSGCLILCSTLLERES